MYNETDYTEIKSQLKKIIIIAIVISLIFIIPSLIFLLRKPQWIGASVLSVGTCLVVFISGVYGTPIYNYYRYLRDIKEGRTQEVKGQVVNITDEPVYKDNRLLFYEILIKDAKDGLEKLLLFDENKGKPQIAAGSNYSFRTHQNYIVQINDF